MKKITLLIALFLITQGYAAIIVPTMGTICGAPSNVVAGTLTTSSATMTWDAVPGSLNYEYVLDFNASDPFAAGTSTTTTSYSATSLASATTYYFHVRNSCDAGALSPWTTIAFTTPVPFSGCLTAGFGQYPFSAYTPSECDGIAINTITTFGYAGEYSRVVVSSGQTYTFISSNETDFITISADEGITGAAYGATPLNWVSTIDGEIRFYTHADVDCGENNSGRTRAIICGIPSSDTPDFANIQFPATIDITQGGSGVVYGQVYEAGLTDVIPNIDGQAPGIQAWIGISPIGSDTNPNTWTTWILADLNAGSIGNNDEYQATIGANLLPGTYYYASRFRLNNGPYVYGATNNGFWDGTTHPSGVLTVAAPPPPANDACLNAVALVPGVDFAASAIGVSTLGATSDALIPTCQQYYAGNIWYTVVVPPSGNITLETGIITGSTFTDSILAAYSGDCASLTEIDCDDDSSTGFFSLINLTNRTPGEVIYVSLWRYSFGGGGTDGALQIAAYDASLSSNEFSKASHFKAYPNPVKDILNLSYDKNITNVSVFNLVGQEVITKAINANQSQIDMSHLAVGTYMVKITADNQIKTIKVIKE